MSTRDGNPDVYVMNADGSSQVALTSNTFTDARPNWSRHTAQIAFMSNRDGNMEIYA